MTIRYLGYLGCIALAVCVPLGALIAAAETDDIIAPFGWVDVAAAHLLMSIPLCLFIARYIPKPQERTPAFITGTAWMLLAIGIAWFTAARGPTLAGGFDQSIAGFFPVRAVIRWFWCICLQLPWCLAARAWLEPAPLDQRPWIPTGLAAALCLLVALFLPMAYTRSVIHAQTTKAEEMLRVGRLTKLQPVVRRLCIVASGKPIAGVAPHLLRQKIEHNITALSKSTAQPLPESASAKERLERARAFAVLGRSDEAEHILTPMSHSDSDAALLLAAILQDDHRWDDSNRFYRVGLKLCEGKAHASASQDARVRAYDGLAFNAREQKQQKAAEAIYFEAMEAVPAAKGHFHFQLGRHYQQAGRPGDAVEQFQIASRLSPDPYAKMSQPLIDQMTLHTPSCVLRWLPQ